MYRCSSEGRSRLYVISRECEGFLCQVFSMYQGLAIFVFSPALTLRLELARLCHNCMHCLFYLSFSLIDSYQHFFPWHSIEYLPLTLGWVLRMQNWTCVCIVYFWLWCEVERNVANSKNWAIFTLFISCVDVKLHFIKLAVLTQKQTDHSHNLAVHIVNTSNMIHHHASRLSKQQTADLLVCHGTQQDLSLSTA